MKRNIVIFIFLVVGALYLFSPNNDPISQAAETLNQRVAVAPKMKDTVQVQKAAIKREKPEVKDALSSQKAIKEKLIQDIMAGTKLETFREQMYAGIKASYRGKNKSEEKLEKLAKELADYPLKEEFEKTLSDYSEEELNYLKEYIEHPANKIVSQAQKENTKELMKITQSKEVYQATPEKQEMIDQIVDSSKAIDMAMAISEATSRPIFMAIHKMQKPKANIHELEAYADQVLGQIKGSQTKTIKSVMNWSFEKVSMRQLDDYLRLVQQGTDRRINDKYLADMKRLYGKFGAHVGKVTAQFMKK